MFKKKLLIVISLIFFTGCEYKPIYSNDNRTNYKIVIQELTGDKNLNKFLIEILERNSQKNSNQVVNIKIDTQYTKKIIAKDTAGNTTDYQASAITIFLIEQNQKSKKFAVTENFNFQKMTDKYEEKGYEQNIKRNLANSIAQKLILRLSIAQ